MKRGIWLTLLILGIWLISLPAKSQSISPPPVSRVDFHENTGDWKNTVMIMKFFGEMSWFDVFTYTKSINEKRGWEFTPALGKFPFGMTLIGGGFSLISELKGGEKIDIAGEIVQKKLSLSYFTNGSFYYLGGSGMSMTYITAQTGLISDIPINWAFSLQPFLSLPIFASINSNMNMSGMSYNSNYTKWFGGLYPGMEIVLTPFRNDRSWKVSLGMLLSLVESNKEGFPTFIIGIKHEWGKYFTGTNVEMW